MKYIKTYEKFELTPQNFRDIKYWRYRNSQVDTILKLIEYKERDSWNEYYAFLIYYLDNDSFHGPEYFTRDMIWGIIRIEEEKKILRPATDKEIKEFDLREQAQKYNL